jgi:hypothetical protein
MELTRFDRPASPYNVEAYLGGMFKACEFCLTHGNKVPVGPERLREIKHDGFRIRVERDRPYQSGRSKHWIMVKNRKHPAMGRVMESFS